MLQQAISPPDLASIRIYTYYDYYSSQGNTQGFITADKTYFLETNFYDLTASKFIWSVQTEAHNPFDIEKWSKKYSGMFFDHLKKEGIIKQ